MRHVVPADGTVQLLLRHGDAVHPRGACGGRGQLIIKHQFPAVRDDGNELYIVLRIYHASQGPSKHLPVAGHILPGIDLIHQPHNVIVRVYLKQNVRIGVQPYVQAHPDLFQIGICHALHVLSDQFGCIIVGDDIHQGDRQKRRHNKGRYQPCPYALSVKTDFAHGSPSPFYYKKDMDEKNGKIIR